MSIITRLSRNARLPREARLPLDVRQVVLAVSGGSWRRPRGHSRFGPGCPWVPGFLWGPAGRSRPGQEVQVSLSRKLLRLLWRTHQQSSVTGETRIALKAEGAESAPGRGAGMDGSGLRTHLHARRPQRPVAVSAVLALKSAAVSISNVGATLVGGVFKVPTGSPRGP